MCGCFMRGYVVCSSFVCHGGVLNEFLRHRVLAVSAGCGSTLLGGGILRESFWSTGFAICFESQRDWPRIRQIKLHFDVDDILELRQRRQLIEILQAKVVQEVARSSKKLRASW